MGEEHGRTRRARCSREDFVKPLRRARAGSRGFYFERAWELEILSRCSLTKPRVGDCASIKSMFASYIVYATDVPEDMEGPAVFMAAVQCRSERFAHSRPRLPASFRGPQRLGAPRTT